MTDKVLDFVSKRQENIEKKRRSFERILFQNFLGAYTVLNKEGTIYPIQLVDISESGCLFQIPWDAKKDQVFVKGEEIPLRMYFTKQSFIPVNVSIIYSKEFIDTDGTVYMHYGCGFDKSTSSFRAINSFIQFLYHFAEHSTIDKDETKVFFI